MQYHFFINYQYKSFVDKQETRTELVVILSLNRFSAIFWATVYLTDFNPMFHFYTPGKPNFRVYRHGTLD